MELICENQEVLHKLTGENCLLDTEIEKIEISKENWNVFVDVLFCMRPKADWLKTLLRFSYCEYYALNFQSNRHFYVVTHLKFFLSDEGKFYASFDPYDEERIISDDDNDVIYSGCIQAYKVA